MHDIPMAQEKAREAIDLLKEAVFAVVKLETETGSGVTRAGIRNWLEIGKENYPTPEDIQWDMGQVVMTILLLLQEDGLVKRNPSNNKKWILSERGKARANLY